MASWSNFNIIILVIFALSTVSLASPDQTSSINNIPYLAPLTTTDPRDEKRDGQYIVTLHDDYDLDLHLTYIEQNININPLKDWELEWIEPANSYHAKHVTAAQVHVLRRDEGVEEVMENCIMEMGLVEPQRPGMPEKTTMSYEEIEALVAAAEMEAAREEQFRDEL